MKTIAVSVSCLVGSALAGKSQITDALKQLSAKNNATDEPTNRAFAGLIAGFLEPIDHYGCWCYFSEDYVFGKGPIQDGIDADCKILNQGYRCAKMDAIARGNDCNPATIVYTPYNFFSSTVDISSECRNSNLNNDNPECAYDACMIEGAFTLKYFDTFFLGLQFQTELQHAVHGGAFDASVCELPPGNKEGPKACCGEVPERASFNTDKGAKSCCGNNIYSTLTNMCCNGAVSGLGVC